MIKARAVLACALVLAFAISAAEEAPVVEKPLTKEESLFRTLDKNNDQKLSPEELRADPDLKIDFKAADTDHDGFLSLAEFVAALTPRANREDANREDTKNHDR